MSATAQSILPEFSDDELNEFIANSKDYACLHGE